MNVFRTFVIPAAQGANATKICDALGFPDKNMFVAKVADGASPAMGQPDTRTIIGYVSSGVVDDASPVLGTAAALWTALNTAPRTPGTITLAECQAFTAALELTAASPLPHIDGIVKECNGTAVTTPWVQPAGAQDAYPIDAAVTYGGKSWRNLMDANVWAPGVTGWRQFWVSGTTWLEWVQPLGAQDAYHLGALVAHLGKHWQNTGSDANVWEPGVFGWIEVA